MKAGVLGKKVKTLSNLISTLAFEQILQSWKLVYVSLLFSCFLSFFLPSLVLWGLSSVGLFVLRPPGTCPSVRPYVTLFCLTVCLFVCLFACLSVYLCGLCLSVSQSVFSSFFLCASDCSPEDSIFLSGNQVSEFAYTPRRTHWHDLKWHLQDQTPVDSRQPSLLLSLTSHIYLQRGKK